MPSSSSSTSESGGISKKKFAPTIPLSRGKKLSDCEMKKNKWLERKPFESNARNKIYFANKPHFNQHRPYYNSRADSKPLPAPYKKPELIQASYCKMFSASLNIKFMVLFFFRLKEVYLVMECYVMVDKVSVNQVTK